MRRTHTLIGRALIAALAAALLAFAPAAAAQTGNSSVDDYQENVPGANGTPSGGKGSSGDLGGSGAPVSDAAGGSDSAAGVPPESSATTFPPADSSSGDGGGLKNGQKGGDGKGTAAGVAVSALGADTDSDTSFGLDSVTGALLAVIQPGQGSGGATDILVPALTLTALLGGATLALVRRRRS